MHNHIEGKANAIKEWKRKASSADMKVLLYLVFPALWRIVQQGFPWEEACRRTIFRYFGG